MKMRAHNVPLFITHFFYSVMVKKWVSPNWAQAVFNNTVSEKKKL